MVSPPTPPLCLGGWEHLTSPLFCLYVCICVYVCNVTHVYCVCCMHVLALLFSSSLYVCIGYYSVIFWRQPKPAPLVKILHLCTTKRGLSDTHSVNKSKPTV